MHEIRIRLWRNAGVRDWSAEIDGQRFEHLPVEEIEELVAIALIRIETSFIAAESDQ